jgi:hypothetical protein
MLMVFMKAQVLPRLKLFMVMLVYQLQGRIVLFIIKIVSGRVARLATGAT